MSSIERPKIALALGSGAARGLAHIGVLREVERQGFQVAAIAGTSIGAVIGGFYAAGALDRAEEIYRSFSINDVIRSFDPIFPSAGLIDGRKMIRTVREVVGEIQLDETDIPFYPIATELDTGRMVVLSDCRLWQAIRASIAIPGLMKPYAIQGTWYVDGGLTNPVPVDILSERHRDLPVIAVNLNLPPDRYERKWMPSESSSSNSLFDRFPRIKELLEKRGIEVNGKRSRQPGLLTILNRTFHVFQYEIAWRSLALNPPDLVITPQLPDLVFYDFHKAARAIAEGERAAREALSEWRS